MARYNNIYYNEDRYKIEEANRAQTNCEKANRIQQLENIVENHTRTERHLETHSDITSLEKLSEAIVKQSEREYNIDMLESKILNKGQPNSNHLNGLEKNYAYAKEYIEHNKKHMDREALENLNERQQNRRDELSGLI